MSFLGDLPSTSYRIFVTTLCFVAITVTVCACLWFEKEVDIAVLGTMLAATTGMAGVDYLQFAKKRDTYQPSPPATPDVEDVPQPEAG